MIKAQLYVSIDPMWGKAEIRLVDALAANEATAHGYEIDGDPEETTDEHGKTVRFWRLKPHV